MFCDAFLVFPLFPVLFGFMMQQDNPIVIIYGIVRDTIVYLDTIQAVGYCISSWILYRQLDNA